MRLPPSARDVLPLPRDYFECPELAHDEEERLIQVARMSCRRLIETTYSPNAEWSTVSVKNGVRISKNIQALLREDMSSISDNQHTASSGYVNTGEDAGPSSAKLIRGTTTVSATIEEIALQFKVDRGHNLMKSRKDILDSMVLYNLVRPTGARPRDYVGIFWECVKSPVPFSHHRDFLYLECHEEFHTPDGRRGWSYAMHSINLPCCPPLDALKLTRATLSNSGFVFIETRKVGEIECHYYLDLDAKGPPLVSEVMARRKISALSHLNKVLQEQRLESETLLGDLELPHQLHSKIECVLCYKRFQFFHRKFTCRKCGEVVCKSCQSTWELDLPGVGIRQICICTLCSANSRGTSSHPDTLGRMREVYEEGEANVGDHADRQSEGGATMVTDISCSISQYFVQQQESSEVGYDSRYHQPHHLGPPPVHSRENMGGPVHCDDQDHVYADPKPFKSHRRNPSPQHVPVSASGVPPMLMDHGGESTSRGGTNGHPGGSHGHSVPRPAKVHVPPSTLPSPPRPTKYLSVDISDPNDDVISLGSEERFSFHSRQPKRLHGPSQGLASALGSVRLGAVVPETIDDGDDATNSFHRKSSPHRLSYDACANNLVNPTTWKHPASSQSTGGVRIDIGSNKRFG
ncbi:hypothetical protein H310_01762 [Aphanomyces invadans]|uniref:FYVE-type domain-containing protein n=1 Tax=Aphanomyces invadans TaxID=157072 RepID=A0A024ULS0_9STRA|nr:hypothetical protein H310_01762 [Aphanomyces invadans]ETW07130.1 hypothetical protein H310_01762 [Aphanomyces invadans]|eukprot:XP_008863223.1 hypothetical protein H310_01762 [Aphanomyces invadans]